MGFTLPSNFKSGNSGQLFFYLNAAKQMTKEKLMIKNKVVKNRKKIKNYKR